MIQQLTPQQSKEKTYLELCSRCINHEINSWIEENWKFLDEETKKLIHEELKAIRLKDGKCIVCSSSLVASETSLRILDILKEKKIQEDVVEQFKKFFVCAL